jgi:hypothetical protein
MLTPIAAKTIANSSLPSSSPSCRRACTVPQLNTQLNTCETEKHSVPCTYHQIGFLLALRVLLAVRNQTSLSADLGCNVIVRETSG